MENRVKELRARFNYSQTDLAKRVGVTRAKPSRPLKRVIMRLHYY